MKRLPRLHRKIACANARTLQQAFHQVADADWVDSFTVDLPNLSLELRLTAPWQVASVLEAQLARLERIANGHAF
jgi:hypothetical protein